MVLKIHALLAIQQNFVINVFLYKFKMQLAQKDLHCSFNITKVSKQCTKFEKKSLAESLYGIMHTFL